MSAIFRADISGHKRFHHRFARSYGNAGAKIKRSLKYYVDQVFAQSQIFVPVDTGELKESGEIVKVVDNNKSISYAIRYGYTGATDYAFWVEVREFSKLGNKVHHEPPTQAWYVRDAHAMHIGRIQQRMAERVKLLREDYKKGV